MTVLGVDIGGTKVLVGRVENQVMQDSCKETVPDTDKEEEVIAVISRAIDPLFDQSITAIGVGVPSIVDVKKGIVYDVQNIPSWKEVHLKEILEKKYRVPVHLNNDANCFAIGEKYFGKGQGRDHFVGLIVGTGMAAGLIIHNKLYSGSSCGAGEFGMLPYLDHYYEYYSSGQFFSNIHDQEGAVIYQQARAGEPEALAMFAEFGAHLGNAICAILYALDPDLIIMGGSVSKAYRFFQESLWESIRKMVYRSVPEHLSIELSDNPDIAVLGAAALCYDALPNTHDLRKSYLKTPRNKH